MIRLALIVACVLAAATGTAGAVTRYALVIGNDTGDRDELALHYAENDAEHFAATLVDLGGFGPVTSSCSAAAMPMPRAPH